MYRKQIAAAPARKPPPGAVAEDEEMGAGGDGELGMDPD
jgi:hypothetical protein